MKKLHEHDVKMNFVVKKNNKYQCISTDKFHFIEVRNYVSADCNLDAFLRCYGSAVYNSYFPYEYLSDLNQLRVNVGQIRVKRLDGVK